MSRSWELELTFEMGTALHITAKRKKAKEKVGRELLVPRNILVIASVILERFLVIQEVRLTILSQLKLPLSTTTK